MSHNFKQLAFRRALAAVGLSSLMVLGLATIAVASPMGPGASGDGVVNDVTATEHHGSDSGQPVRSQHAFDPGQTDPNAVALELRSEYYAQRLGTSAGALSVDKVADARALNEPTSSGPTDAVAQLRALNEPSSIHPTDAVAQLRALNEPGTTAQGASLEASDSPATDFPLAQSVAIIAGILVLLAGTVMVVTRNQQSPTTV